MVDIMMMYEVDLRSRKSGDSEECILSTENHDEAYQCAESWNKKNIPDYDVDVPNENYIDGTDGLFAEVYETPKYLAHGVGKYKKY